jgi:hypothetical protein
MDPNGSRARRAGGLIAGAALLLLVTSCGKSCGGAPAGEAEDAGAEAAAAGPAGAKACGDPAATPAQVVREFLQASKVRDVPGMIACFKPKHRDKMSQRPELLVELTALSFTVGEETINGDTAQVAVDIERYDGHGQVQHKRDPIRLERVDGSWYFR